jgi:hypothetical protein
MQASIDAGNLQTIGQKYFSMAKARPLDEVTKLTTAQKGVLEAP